MKVQLETKQSVEIILRLSPKEYAKLHCYLASAPTELWKLLAIPTLDALKNVDRATYDRVCKARDIRYNTFGGEKYDITITQAVELAFADEG